MSSVLMNQQLYILFKFELVQLIFLNVIESSLHAAYIRKTFFRKIAEFTIISVHTTAINAFLIKETRVFYHLRFFCVKSRSKDFFGRL